MELRTIRIIGMIDGVVLLFYFIWCLVNLKLPYEKIFKRFSPHDNSFFFVVCRKFIKLSIELIQELNYCVCKSLNCGLMQRFVKQCEVR